MRIKMKLALRIAFLGTNYCGYQLQPNGVTVQEKINQAVARVFGDRCDVTGCSRTDSGVHANDFCLTVCDRGSDSLETTIPDRNIIRALNTYLPEDIAVKSLMWVDGNFHPRYSVKYKEYIYRIYNAPVRSPFETGRSLYYPHPLDSDKLEAMNAAARHFIGKHDFRAFMASGSDITDTERHVMDAEVCRIGDLVLFRVSADGFLYNMVRIMTGTLLEVAEGRIIPDDIPSIIASLDRGRAGRTAPACGLYLNRVVY